MKGNNTLILNEATMIIAVQEYLNKRFVTDTPVADRITAETTNHVPCFKIKLIGKDDANEERRSR